MYHTPLLYLIQVTKATKFVESLFNQLKPTYTRKAQSIFDDYPVEDEPSLTVRKVSNLDNNLLRKAVDDVKAPQKIINLDRIQKYIGTNVEEIPSLLVKRRAPELGGMDLDTLIKQDKA